MSREVQRTDRLFGGARWWKFGDTANAIASIRQSLSGNLRGRGECERMNYDLVRPCDNCPFRSDKPFFFSRERAEEIADGITRQQRTFTCHKTTVACGEDEEFGGMKDGPNAQHCAGAMILLEKLAQPNQMMRIAERLGMYDRTKLDMDAPVYDSVEEFIDGQA
jgi:hypothetical protein